MRGSGLSLKNHFKKLIETCNVSEVKNKINASEAKRKDVGIGRYFH